MQQKTPEEVKAEYNKTDWGKLLIELGFDPYDTESCARTVARGAARMITVRDMKIEELERTLKIREDQLRRIAESVEHLLPPK